MKHLRKGSAAISWPSKLRVLFYIGYDLNAEEKKKKKKSSIIAKVNSHIVQEENIMWPRKKQWFNSFFLPFEFIFRNFNSSAFSGGNYDEWGHQIYMTWLGNITK